MQLEHLLASGDSDSYGTTRQTPAEIAQLIADSNRRAAGGGGGGAEGDGDGKGGLGGYWLPHGKLGQLPFRLDKKHRLLHMRAQSIHHTLFQWEGLPDRQTLPNRHG